MAFEQNPNGFASDPGNDLSLDRLLSDQTDGPPRTPLRRSAADHSDDPLFLGSVEQLRVSLAGSLIKRPLQAMVSVALRDGPYRGGSKANQDGNLRSAKAGIKLQEGKGAQNHAHLLDAAF